MVVIEEKPFGQMIGEVLERKEIKQASLANECKITSSSVNRILQSQTEYQFDSILAIVQRLVEIDSDLREESFMIAYISEVNTVANIKSAMEYCDTHDMKQMLEILCERAGEKASRKNHLQEYINMYRVNMERKAQQANKYVSKEMLNKVLQQNNKTKEMKTFQLILELECYHQERSFYKVLDFLPKLKKKIGQPENSLQKSLSFRLNKLSQTIYLRHVCDYEALRRLANEALSTSIGKRFEAAAYANIGDSHILDEDPTTAIMHLEKSIRLYEEIGLEYAAEFMRKKVEFISVLRGLKVDKINNQQNIALYHILEGDQEKGLAILDSLDGHSLKVWVRTILHIFGIHYQDTCEQVTGFTLNSVFGNCDV